VTLPAPGASTPTENEVKAVFLFKFAKFIEWPPRAFTNATAPLVLGVIGAEAIAAALETVVANETYAGRPIHIRRVAPGEEARACHVLYLTAPEPWAALQVALGTNATLTVSDQDHFLDRGGMIQFLKIENTVRFAINQPAATRCGLTLRSQLLRLSQSRPSD
jgi:hypothetical protein